MAAPRETEGEADAVPMQLGAWCECTGWSSWENTGSTAAALSSAERTRIIRVRELPPRRAFEPPRALASPQRGLVAVNCIDLDAVPMTPPPFHPSEAFGSSAGSSSENDLFV